MQAPPAAPGIRLAYPAGDLDGSNSLRCQTALNAQRRAYCFGSRHGKCRGSRITRP